MTDRKENSAWKHCADDNILHKLRLKRERVKCLTTFWSDMGTSLSDCCLIVQTSIPQTW